MSAGRIKTHMRAKDGARPRRPAESVVAKLLLKQYAGQPGPIFVAVGGPGGTGKSLFSAKLAAHLGDANVLTLDDYKTARSERAVLGLSGPHPDANQMELLGDQLARLKRGETVEKPVYDLEQGASLERVAFVAKRFAILDGEVSTYPVFREWVDFSIFIDSDWITQLNTRIARDIDERGHSREKVIETFLRSNLREFQAYGAESKQWADVHLYCSDDYHLAIESVADELFQRFQGLLEADLERVDLFGLIVPVLTPFQEDGSVDGAKFVEHLAYLAGHGVTRLLVGGTTGEFFSLDVEEREGLLSLAREYFPGVIAYNASCESLKETCEAAMRAEERGADMVLALPPQYFAGLEAEGVRGYLEAIGECLSVPFVIYNFPHHTQNPVTAEILRDLEHFGMKDSGADLGLVDATPHYYLGGETQILDAYAAGAAGFICSGANVCPELYVEMEGALRIHDVERAETMQESISELTGLFFGAGAIGALKHAVSLRLPDYPAHVRLPLVPVDEEMAERIGDALE